MLAFGWVDLTSPTVEWDLAQVRRLAKRLGYELCRVDARSVLGLVEQVELSGAVAVLLPSTGHVDAATLDRVLRVADVECAALRVSFGRWVGTGGVQR